MDPVLFSIGAVHIHWYGVMMAAGLMAGLASWSLVGRREGRSLNFCSDLLFWIVVAAILGARLAYIASEWREFVANPHLLYRIDQGGLIYYGGFIAATLAVALFAKVKREPLLPLYDFVATSLPLAHAFGRIGCFLNGCCHGVRTSAWFGIRYPANSFAWARHATENPDLRYADASLPVHPVQLYEAMLGFAVYGIVMFVHRKRKRPGVTTAAYLIAYPIVRFGIEFFRGDARAMAGPLTLAQTVSIAILACGLALLLAVRRRPAEPAARQPV